MGQKTEELMTTCRKTTQTFQPLVETIEGKFTKLNQKFNELKKKAVPEKGEKLLRKNAALDWQRELDEIKSNRLDVAKHLELLQNRALREAGLAVKELESKVKTKNILNVFKDQRSLEEAKKLVKQSQQLIDRTEEKLTAFNTAYTKFDASCDNLTDLLKQSLKEGVDDQTAQELTARLQRHLNKTIPNGLIMLKNVQAIGEKKAELVKKLGSAIGKTKTWTSNARQAMLDEIQAESDAITKVIDNVPTVLLQIQFDWDEVRAKTPRNILNMPATRQLIKQTETEEARAVELGNNALRKLEATRVEMVELQSDVVAAGVDDNREAIAKGIQTIEEFAMLLEDSPTRLREGHISDGKRDLQFLLTLAKKIAAASEEERKRLTNIRVNYGPSGKMATQQWVDTVNRTNRMAEGLVNRFKKDAGVLSAYKEYKQVYQTAKKQADTYVKLADEIEKRANQLQDALP